MNESSVVAVKAAEEIIKVVNEEYKSGICTYTEMKTAINNGCYVARAVCEFNKDDFDKIREFLAK